MNQVTEERPHEFCKALVPKQHSALEIVPQAKPYALPNEALVGQSRLLWLSIELLKEPACTQESGRSNLANCCLIAAPYPLSWMLRILHRTGLITM
ncbi:hypothetical protein IH601_05310 [Candidatus Bipolaricaulota bacterium]|nr:hypothetical protein [Candidatus Bipolaricaulota bacterium]